MKDLIICGLISIVIGLSISLYSSLREVNTMHKELNTIKSDSIKSHTIGTRVYFY